MKKVLTFLRQLERNNNREWFMAHKEEYVAAQARWNAFSEELIERIGEFDPTVRGLTAKDRTYRIYRDVRFSKDKSPYKNHMGVYVCRGGKKSGFSGYYFQICASKGEQEFDGHCMAAGDYMCLPSVLQVLREDIENETDDFRHHLDLAATAGFHLYDTWKLKRVPRGFNPDSPCADLLKYKVYGLMTSVDDEFVLAPDLARRVADSFRTTHPFLNFVNRAIEYVQEEMRNVK